MTAFQAKKLGKQVNLRKDWESVKLNIMYEIVFEKFKQNPELKDYLLLTENEELIEGNNWKDTYWGMIKDKNNNWIGENNLGKILMRVRSELKN